MHWEFRIVKIINPQTEEPYSIKEVYFEDSGEISDMDDVPYFHGATLQEVRDNIALQAASLNKPIVIFDEGSGTFTEVEEIEE